MKRDKFVLLVDDEVTYDDDKGKLFEVKIVKMGLYIVEIEVTHYIDERIQHEKMGAETSS